MAFQLEIPTKITIEMNIVDKAFYESRSTENIEHYIFDFQKLAKFFRILENAILYVLGEKKKRSKGIKNESNN